MRFFRGNLEDGWRVVGRKRVKGAPVSVERIVEGDGDKSGDPPEKKILKYLKILLVYEKTPFE